MNVSFSVMMMLQSVNRMEPGIRSAQRMINGMGKGFNDVARRSSALNPVQGWGERIATATRRMEEFGKKAGDVRKQAEKLLMNGMKDIAMGGSIVLPVVATLKPAADLETKFTTMRVMGLSDKGGSVIRKQSIELAKNLAFNLSQVVGVAQALQKAGMNEAKIIHSQRIATSYAQLEYNRYGADPNQTATHLAHIAESSGVLYATKQERRTHGLITQTDIDNYIVGKFRHMAETLNRVVAVTSSDTATLAESVKYSMPTAKSLGWSEESAMLMSGIYSRFGIESSMSGTHLKDFAARLNPYQHYLDEDAGSVNKRLTAMQAAGWLEGARWVTTKAGKKKFYSVGSSAFHNDDGTLKGPVEVFSRIYEAYERFNSQGKRLQFEGILHDVLGEQGKDIAQLLNQNPEMFKHIKEDMGKVLSMDKSLEKYQKNVNTQWDIFKGNIATTRTLIGDLFLQDASDTLQNWNEKLFGKVNKKSPAAQWIEDHKELIVWITKTALIFAALTTGVGLLKIVAAGIRFAFVSPLMTLVGWLGKGTRHAHMLYDAFKYFRGKGGKFFESIAKGAQFAYPWLGKIMRWVSKFTPFWLRSAARIAAGWLVAMGPVGWIILGVSAIIAAAVLAWKTNFMGFRDKCLAIWKLIKDYIDYVWPTLSHTIREFIKTVKGYWDSFKKFSSEIWDGIVKIIQERLAFLDPVIQNFTNAWKKYFGGVAEAAKSMLQDIWDAQLGVQIIKGVQKHWENFKIWRQARNAAERDDFNELRKRGANGKIADMHMNLVPLIMKQARDNDVHIVQNNHFKLNRPDEAAPIMQKGLAPGSKYLRYDFNPSNG